MVETLVIAIGEPVTRPVRPSGPMKLVERGRETGSRLPKPRLRVLATQQVLYTSDQSGGPPSTPHDDLVRRTGPRVLETIGAFRDGRGLGLVLLV